MTTQMAGIFASMAVAITDILALNPPSPVREIAARSGLPCLTPRTAAGPNPMVANPLVVMNVPGTVNGNCWATPFLFQPTSVTTRSEEHTSELQSLRHLVCRLLLEKKT